MTRPLCKLIIYLNLDLPRHQWGLILTIIYYWYNLLFRSHAALKPRKFSKSPLFSLKHNKVSSRMPCVAEHVTSNSGKRSDALHSTRENSENLNRWFLLNGKHPSSNRMVSRLTAIASFSSVFFNSCNIQGNIKAFWLTRLIWWQKLTQLFQHFL